MANCNTCALQYRDACPHQFDNVPSCSKYVEKHFDPQPPRRDGRYRPEPGEYPRGQRIPPRPATGSSKRAAGAAKKTATGSRRQTVTRKPVRSVPAVHVPRITVGHRLFYRDKNTGIINCGVVTAVYKDGFDYLFDRRTVFLSYDVIGARLFFTWKGAWQYYIKQKGNKS